MVVSTKTRYGFRFLIQLGLKYGKGISQIKEVAEKEKISIKYLEHIASILKLSGIVKVERGSKGGYYLSKPPELMTLLEIMEPLEVTLQLIECNEENNSCELKNGCVMGDFWKDMSDYIKDYLKKRTLADLVESYKIKNRDVMYYI